jgi:hypothetical protein
MNFYSFVVDQTIIYNLHLCNSSHTQVVAVALLATFNANTIM